MSIPGPVQCWCYRLIMTTIEDNLQQVRGRIATACARADRDVTAVTLLAVSKTFGPDAVLQALAAGQRAFGENYIQEGVEKILALRETTPSFSSPSLPSLPISGIPPLSTPG